VTREIRIILQHGIVFLKPQIYVDTDVVDKGTELGAADPVWKALGRSMPQARSKRSRNFKDKFSELKPLAKSLSKKPILGIWL
jgi:hypothetical protein